MISYGSSHSLRRRRRASVSGAPLVSGFQNKPGGWATIEDQPWNSTVPTNWIDDAGNAGTAFSIVADSTAPISPPNTNAGLFPSGSPGGSGPFYLWRHLDAVGYHSIYIGMACKHSANFDNTGQNNGPGNVGTKFWWPSANIAQGSDTYLSFNAGTMDFEVFQQNLVDRELGLNVGAAGNNSMVGSRGSWNIYELILGGNSNVGATDGTLDVWINNIKTHHYTDVAWNMGSGVTPATRLWLSLAWNPTYGGGLNPVPHDQYEYMDHLTVLGN